MNPDRSANVNIRVSPRQIAKLALLREITGATTSDIVRRLLDSVAVEVQQVKFEAAQKARKVDTVNVL